MLIKAGWWWSISASFHSEPAGGAVAVFVSRLLCLSHSIDRQMQMRGAAQQNINVGLAGGAADLASRPRVQCWTSVLCCCTGARDHSITKQASHSVLNSDALTEKWEQRALMSAGSFISISHCSTQQRPLCGEKTVFKHAEVRNSSLICTFCVFSHSWTFYAMRKFWERTTHWNLLLWQDGDLRWVLLQKDEFCGKMFTVLWFHESWQCFVIITVADICGHF